MFSKEDKEATALLNDPSRGSVGLQPAYAEHSNIQTMQVYHSLVCGTGADVYIQGQERSTPKGDRPFAVKGIWKGGYKVYGGQNNEELLYTVRLKYRSWKYRFIVEDANGQAVADVAGCNSFKGPLLTAKFANALSGQSEQRLFELRSGDNRKVVELFEGDHAIATFERPGFKFSKMAVSEPRIITVSPRVDTCLVLLIYLCRHYQVVLQQASGASAASASSSAAAAAVAA